MKDVMKPSMYGVGVLGGVISTEERSSKVYASWNNMLKRCYSTKESAQRSSYEGCYVSNNFCNYQYFKEWYNNQIGHNQDGWDLDKDLLIKGNKVYTEDCCVLLPKEVNNALTQRKTYRGEYPIGVSYKPLRNQYRARCNRFGKNVHLGWFSTVEDAFSAYKKAKETYLRDLATKWKDKIDHRAYEALMNYQVEITD